MRGARALLGAIGAICAIAPAASFAADTPVAAKKPAATQNESKPASECSGYGTGFFKLGDSGFCGRAGYDVMGFAAKDFAVHDIGLVGQRLPSSAYAAGVPILYYYDKNFSSETRNPYPGVDAQVNFVAMRQTDYGALTAYVNVRAAGQLQDNESGDMRYVANNAVNGSVLQGLVDQAWVRLDGLEVGVQPSMFGFARWGYSISPGYSSLLNTPAVSYTYRVDNVAGSNNSVSASVALEDPTRRDMADGVLADYGAAYWPDVVAQARFGSPSVLLHIGGALHQIHDEAAWDCCYSPDHALWSPRRPQAANIASSGATSSARRRGTLTAACCCRSRRRAARSAISAFRSSPLTMSSAATATSNKRRAIPRSPPTSICGRRR